jgi:hypothetical protein
MFDPLKANLKPISSQDARPERGFASRSKVYNPKMTHFTPPVAAVYDRSGSIGGLAQPVASPASDYISDGGLGLRSLRSLLFPKIFFPRTKPNFARHY